MRAQIAKRQFLQNTDGENPVSADIRASLLLILYAMLTYNDRLRFDLSWRVLLIAAEVFETYGVERTMSL